MAADPSPSKARALRDLLEGPELAFLMEAHDGVSARIAEEAGFPGLWASGLAISASLGVRDNNELSWTHLVDRLEFLSDATTVPILVDGDTGHGNFNNFRRLVAKLEQRGLAGICVEDKLFPKTNSFLHGERQALAEVTEFCGKIRAGKDTQRDPDFRIVARVEALIAGWGLDEALRRAEAYDEAGADAILIHSKSAQPDEVLAFAAEWAGRSPLMVVPTTYYSTPADAFRRAGVSAVIWANHLLRSAVASMQATARAVARAEGVAGIEDGLAPLREVFRLQGADELAHAEERYFGARREVSAVVLAATRGEGLEELTEDRPKIMVPIAGRPLLRHLVDAFKGAGVGRVTVVAGYRAEAVELSGIEVVRNPRFDEGGELTSLERALEALGPDSLILYGDLLFRRYILRDLLAAPGDLVAVVDSDLPGEGSSRDLAWCSAPDDRALVDQPVVLLRVAASRAAGDAPAHGRWIGMLRVQGEGRARLLEALSRLRVRPDFVALDMPDLLNELVAHGGPVHVSYIHGHWLDVNHVADLDRAGRFAIRSEGSGDRSR